jgi:hypothetical protein
MRHRPWPWTAANARVPGVVAHQFCGMFFSIDRAARIRSAQDLGAGSVPLYSVRFPLLALFPSTVRITVHSPHRYTHSRVGLVMYTTNHRAPQGLALRAQSTGQAQRQTVHTISIVFKRPHYRLAGTAGAHQMIPGMHAPTHTRCCTLTSTRAYRFPASDPATFIKSTMS